MAPRKPLGFTLVELLVVISIIGMLMALLLPAVNAVRENGRRTQCANNQGQIAKAMFSYVTNKGSFPGYRGNRAGTGATPLERDTSWFVAIAPVEAPRFAIAVIVERGGEGSSAALPVARQVLAAALGVQP